MQSDLQMVSYRQGIFSHASTPSGSPNSPGGALGGLSAILDQNGDGSIMDDLARMSGGAKSGGCLSALLGGLLGRGKRRCPPAPPSPF